MNKFTRRAALGTAAAFGFGAAAMPSWAQTTNLRVHTTSPGTSSFTFTTAMQTVVQRATPYVMNVTSGQTSTRSTLDASKGQVDLFISSPAINHYMKEGIQMYEGMSDAPELFKNIRQVMNFPLGPYHIITYADSGIETLEDCRGRRIFVGPPGGAATTVGLSILESATGMKPGDYEQAKLDWTSGQQAFQDRQVDLAIIPTELPSASIMQFALLGKIKLISIPDIALTRGPLQTMLTIPGRTLMEIPAGIYGNNQMNDAPVRAVGSWVGLGSHVDVDEQIVYDVTKAIFDNLSDMHAAADWIKVVTPETALLQLNAPVHLGAYRWYMANGVEVPEEFTPPEAK